MKKKLIFFYSKFVISFLILFLYLNWPMPSKTRIIDFSIKKGEAIISILNRLHQKKLIRNYYFGYVIFKGYLLVGKKFLYGNYKIPYNLSTLSIISLFFNPKNLYFDTKSISINAGHNIYEIDDLLFKNNFIKFKNNFIKYIHRKDVLDRFNKSYGLNVKTLEGFLLPNTYFFHKADSLDVIIRKITLQFWKKFPLKDFLIQKNKLNMDFYDILILASLIQKESYLSDEKNIISSVFHNRLKKNMRLQCDPTVIYALTLNNKYTGKLSRKNGDLSINSKYNTYLYKGLPPTPIANPDTESIYAAIYPKETDYLFFVVNEFNRHSFSTNFKDHKIHVQKFKKFREKLSKK